MWSFLISRKGIFILKWLRPQLYVAYLLRKEDNPRYGEEGCYDPTCETEWHEEIIKIYR